MARKPASGKMRTPVEYGKMKTVFDEVNGGMSRQFVLEGQFWAQKIGVGMTDGANIARSVAGVDISDDITKLWTWVGHDVTSEHYCRINGTLYSIIAVNVNNDEQMVEYWVVSGLRDTKG